MDLSLGVVTAMPIMDSLPMAKASERTGYRRVWVGEDIFHRDIFTYLSILALKNESIGLASGVTSPYVRNKQVIASSVKAVSELSNGRFTLGIGVGGLPEVERLTGARPKSVLTTMEETIGFLKEKTGLEIYVGARGPKMLELSGRVADGVILSGPKRYIERAVQLIDHAAGDRVVRKVLWNAFYLGDNPKLVSKVTEVMLESMPVFAKRFMDLDNEWGKLCISGSGANIVDDLREYMAMGIDEFVVGPPYGDEPLKVIEEVAGLWKRL